jgi:hypothetical protein
MKNLLKIKLQKFFVIFLIYNWFNEVTNYIKFNIIYRFKYKYKYLKKRDLLKMLKKKQKIKNSTICHIIGAGNSLNYSKKKISKKDFVLGCNLSALTNINFDFYTVEFASNEKFTEPKFLTSYLVKKKLLKKKTIVIFKNLTSTKIDRNFLTNNYQNYINLITDYSWRCFNNEQLEYYLKNNIFTNSKKFYQYNSTLVLLISIAYQLGFKKIILHGVDFGGRYFYSSKINELRSQIKNDHIKELKLHEKKNISKHGVYINFKTLNMPNVFKKISNILKENGTSLYSASRFSKSSKFLKVYQIFK